MALRVALQLTGDARGAKVAVDETVAAVKYLEGEMQAAAWEAQQLQKAHMAAMGSATTGAKLSTHQLQQMQFQISDLAVQLASGASPFMAIAQQGSQIAGAFGPGTGALGALKALGAGIGAFVTNPLNLSVIAIAGVSAAIPAIWGAFTGSEAEEAADGLQAFDGYMKDLKESALEAAKAAEEVAKVGQSLEELRAGAVLTQEELQASFRLELDGLISKIGDIEVHTGDARAELERLYGSAKILGEAGLADLVRDLETGAKTATEFRQELARVILNPDVVPDVKSLAGELFNASREALNLSARLAALDAAQGRIGRPSLNPAAVADGLGGAGDTYGGRSYLDASRDAQRAAATAGREAERAAREAAQEADRRAKAAQTIADYQAELAALQLTGAAREQALAQLAEEQQIRTAIAGLGASASAEEIAALQSLIPARNAALEASRAQEAQLRSETAAAQSLGQAVGSALGAFATGGEVAKQALVRLGAQMAQLVLQQQLLGSFGNGAGGLNPTGSFISAAISAVFGGFREGGGDVQAGKAYIVGEKRPELFRPSVSGTIIPSVSSGFGGGAGVIEVRLIGEEGGMFVPRVRSISGDVAGVAVKAAGPTIAKAGSALARDDFERTRWGRR